MQSILSLGDSYKYSHSSQYPSNTVSMYSYMESRGGKYEATVFVGLQYYLVKYLTIPVTLQELEKTKLKAAAHGIPFDYDGWLHIINNHNGLLPIKIKAVKEGSLIPVKHVLLTIESTDPAVPWIAGFVETLLMKIWYPTTIATKSYYVKQMLTKYGSPGWAQFAYHNFGDRGATSVEAAAIGGMAHLTQFSGTDNFNALDLCEDFYEEPMAGYSVYATEHSTTTSYGRDGEEQFVYNQLLANPDKPIMSFVADSYDVYNFTEFCTAPGSRIRNLVESRPHQKLVLRPDSGNPLEVLPKMLNIAFHNGAITTGPKGAYIFTDFAFLWGDGITPETIELILKALIELGYAAENFVFGSGGDLMQNINRDTQRFAIKCSNITVAKSSGQGLQRTHYNEDIDVYKDPITDPGKASKRGKVTTWYDTLSGEITQGLVNTPPNLDCICLLQTVFENGKVVKPTILAEIREAI